MGLRIVVAVMLLLLMGCTQQLAQHSQSKWLKNNHSLSLYNTRFANPEGPLRGDVITVLSGFLESTAITELSGLAASQRNPNVFWAINDSGNRAEIFAIDRTGKHLDTFSLPERNIDWEDLASFQYQGKSWLAVADTGDNLRRRNYSTLYLLEEPVLAGSQTTLANQAGVATDDGAQASDVMHSEDAEPQMAAATNGTPRELSINATIEFVYEDGPQNVESMAISGKEGSIYLIAKRGAKSSLYELPLTIVSTTERLTARRVGNTRGLHWTEGGNWFEKRLGSRFLLGPTAMDISADNQLAVIANYRHVYLYRKPADQPWSLALRSKPQIISSHRMAQSESVAFSADGNYVVVGSEGLHAPMLMVR